MLCLCFSLHVGGKRNKKPWYLMSPPGATVFYCAFSRLSGQVRDVIAPSENGHTGTLSQKGLNRTRWGADTIG